MRSVELFCGIGLSSLGLVKAGTQLMGACDLTKQFIDIFNAQSCLPHVAVAMNVDDYEIPPCDLLSAGPVCKAFSPGATVFGTKGSEDDRNTFPHYFRALERSLPDYILIENSYGLQRFKGYLEEILGKLRYYGYQVECQEIDCYDYGVPQHRRRVIILGSKKGPWHITKPENRVGPETVGDCRPWDCTRPMTEGELKYWNRDPRHAKKHPPLSFDAPASTVVSNYKRGVPYGAVRMPDGSLSMCCPRLAARLQGLPEEYDVSVGSRTRMFEGIGNGFPPPVIEYLVRSLVL